MEEVIYFNKDEDRLRFYFVEVDNWVMNNPEDMIFGTTKGALIAPVSKQYNLEPSDLDWFILSPKKCYNSNKMRDHLIRYLNYFEKYYDVDREYLAVMANIKYLIDYHAEYSKQMFFGDLHRYILTSGLLTKVNRMTEENYKLNLSYKNDKNPSLQYTDEHAKILMSISLLMNLCIPLLTHFAYMRKVENIDEYLLEQFDAILYLYPVDIYSKLYETAYTNIIINEKNNQGIWDKQSIRGTDTVTHSLLSVRNIILNIMPRYIYDQNIISFNYASIRRNLGFQILNESSFAVMQSVVTS